LNSNWVWFNTACSSSEHGQKQVWAQELPNSNCKQMMKGACGGKRRGKGGTEERDTEARTEGSFVPGRTAFLMKGKGVRMGARGDLMTEGHSPTDAGCEGG